MFKKILNKLKIKSKTKKTEYKTTQDVSFIDLSGKELTLEIRINGNNTALAIIDKKNNQEFILDHELVTLLNVLLQSYNLHETFPIIEE